MGERTQMLVTVKIDGKEKVAAHFIISGDTVE
jgi:hypothetical protein